MTLDLLVELADGRRVDVEMQSERRPGMRKRVLYHWSRLYEAQLQRGMDHEQLEPCICIFLLDYDELPSSRFHSTFLVLEVHDHDVLCDQFEVHMVELRKLPQSGSNEGLLEGKLADWGRFFQAVDDQELEELPMSDPVFLKAKEVLDRLSADPQVQQTAREREEGLQMYRMELGEARQEGKTEGWAEGKLEAERSTLALLLTQRFGPLPAHARERIDRADSEHLSVWLGRLLSAGSLDEAFASE